MDNFKRIARFEKVSLEQYLASVDFDKEEASIESSLDYSGDTLGREYEGTLVRFTSDLAYLDRSEMASLIKELRPAVQEYINKCNEFNEEHIKDILNRYEENSQKNQELHGEEVFNNLWDELKLDDTLTQNWIEENIDSVEDMNTYELQTEWRNKIIEEYGRRKNINSCLNYNSPYIYDKLKEILDYYKRIL